MAKVNPSTIFLFLDLAGGTNYKTLICLTGFKFTLGTNIIDAGTMCGPDKSPGITDFGLTFDGEQMRNPEVNKVSDGDLFPKAIAKSTIGWKIAPAVPSPGDESIYGSGFIATLDKDYSFDKNANFSGSIGIYGTPVQIITPVS